MANFSWFQQLNEADKIMKMPWNCFMPATHQLQQIEPELDDVSISSLASVGLSRSTPGSPCKCPGTNWVRSDLSSKLEHFIPAFN